MINEKPAILSPATEVLPTQYLKQLVALADYRRLLPRYIFFAKICARYQMPKTDAKNLLCKLELTGVCKNSKRGILLLTEARHA